MASLFTELTLTFLHSYLFKLYDQLHDSNICKSITNTQTEILRFTNTFIYSSTSIYYTLSKVSYQQMLSSLIYQFNHKQMINILITSFVSESVDCELIMY